MKTLSVGYLLLLPFLGASFYFDPPGVAFFPLISSLVSVFYVLRCRGLKYLDEYHSNFIKSFWLLLALCIFSLLVSLINIATMGLSFRLNSFIGLILGFFTFWAINIWSRRSPHDFDRPVKILIFLAIGFFWFQFLFFYFSGVEIDFMVNVTGEEQRLIGHQRFIPGLGNLRRSSGIFAEPALYSYVIISLVTLLVYRRACSLGSLVFCLISAILSFSASGLVFSLFPMMLAIFKSRSFSKWIIILVVCFIIFWFYDFFVIIFQNEINRVSGFDQDSSGIQRLEFIDAIMNDPFFFAFGYGLFSDTRQILPPSGFVASVIFSVGFFGFFWILIVFYFLLRRSLDAMGFLIVALLGLLFNYSFTSVFFWFIFSILAAGVSRAPVVISSRRSFAKNGI